MAAKHLTPPRELSEDPKTVYGRLLESAHISGYSFERCCTELGLLLEGDNWQKVASHADVNEFLRSIDLSAFNLGDKRPQLVKRIKELQPQASQRAIAQAAGVGRATVQRDLGGPNGPPQAKDPAPQLGSSDEGGPNGPPQAKDPAPQQTHERRGRDSSPSPAQLPLAL